MAACPVHCMVADGCSGYAHRCELAAQRRYPETIQCLDAATRERWQSIPRKPEQGRALPGRRRVRTGRQALGQDPSRRLQTAPHCCTMTWAVNPRVLDAHVQALADLAHDESIRRLRVSS